MRPSFFVLALAALSAAFAVDTRFWTFASKEDHDKATMKRLSLRSDGHITLAPAVLELHDAGVSYLWAVARGADGTVYTGGGNPGATTAKVFAVKGGQSRVLAELAGLQIQSIALDGAGRVYAATAPDGSSPPGTTTMPLRSRRGRGERRVGAVHRARSRARLGPTGHLRRRLPGTPAA